MNSWNIACDRNSLEAFGKRAKKKVMDAFHYKVAADSGGIKENWNQEDKKFVIFQSLWMLKQSLSILSSFHKLHGLI